MNATTTPPDEVPMPAEDALLLADVHRRVLERRMATPEVVASIKESVEARLERLHQKIKDKPFTPPQSNAGPSTALLELRAKAGIPQRHCYEIPDGTDRWNETRAGIVKQLSNGFLIAMTGVQGTGKSQLGSALIYAATAKHLPCKYAVAMDFFIALKGTFDDGAKVSEAQVIASFVKPKLLVLDEMDERSESAWENRLLFHMINQRYNNLVDTLLISRKPESEFLSSLGDSVTSRIQETGGSVVCDWPSYREARA